MKTIYSINIRFATVSPLYTARTVYVDTVAAVEAVKANGSDYGYEVTGFSVQHIMTPLEISDEVIRERRGCALAVGQI